MALNIIPMMGTTGVWTAKAPYDTLILTNVIYEVVALRSLIDIIAAGQDPKALYYTPYGNTSANYASDVANGAVIVTLMTTDNSKVSIPSTYFATYPDGNGVPYRIMGLAVRLTALPDSLSLAPLIEKISSDCLNVIGVTPTITEVALSNQQLINATDNAALETQRRNRITSNSTDYALLQAATTALTSAQQRCLMLEKYILKLRENSTSTSTTATTA